MAEPEAARIVHRLPGRVRLKIDQRRYDAAWFEALALELALVEGIRTVEVNPRTASLLLFHDGPLEPVLDALAARGLVRLESLEPREIPLTRRLRERAGRLDARLRQATAGELDLQGAALLGLLFLALVQALRGHVAGPAVSLLWYASNLVRNNR